MYIKLIMTSSRFDLGPTLKTFNISLYSSLNGSDLKTMVISSINMSKFNWLELQNVPQHYAL